MNRSETGDLREKAKNWKCNNFSITEHRGDAAALLRKVARSIEQLGDIEILDLTYQPSADPSALEITVSVYFYFLSESKSRPQTQSKRRSGPKFAQEAALDRIAKGPAKKRTR